MSIVIIIFVMSCAEKGPVRIVSPDGKLQVMVTTQGGENRNALMYDVTFGNTPVVTDSRLGVILKDSKSIVENVNITGITKTTVDETYSISVGKSSPVRNHYNETTLSLEYTSRQKMNVIFRVYDDGVAFRYYFPLQENMQTLEITGELSSFHFPENPGYWGMHLNSYTTAYETEYTVSKIASIKPEELIAMPFLVQLYDNVWIALTEANLTDYAGMYLQRAPGSESEMIGSLSPLPDSSGVAVRAETPCASPWRVLMVGDNPGRLVESNIILNLNDPCAIDTSWIKPGKTAWPWWSGRVVKGEDFEGVMDNRTMRHYIDFASEYNLEYILVDAGWYDEDTTNGDITTSIPEIDIPGLVQYAANKGVDVLIWTHWIPAIKQMDEAFSLYESWGVRGVKIDFMNRDDQEMVNFYHQVVKKAAEHKMVVDFHGAYKPTGFRRTYPNLLTREGVLGLEFCKFEREGKRITPGHDCIVPFTRMLAGPIDYTPGGFSNVTENTFISQRKEPMTRGTRCHQLALYVIFESPLQMLPDYPGNYRNEPGIEFISDVPTTWDLTRVIHASVGEYVTIVRKKGNEWYLGSITNWTPRELNVSLDFLGDGDYTAEIYADGPDADTNPESVSISKVRVNADRKIKLEMGPGGGYAVRFYPHN